jgi:hypothetical protein
MASNNTQNRPVISSSISPDSSVTIVSINDPRVSNQIQQVAFCKTRLVRR